MVTVYIHHQENSNYPFATWFMMYGYDIEVANIIGDIAVPELGIGVERKTVQDFLNSRNDGRLFSQADEMAQTYDEPWLVIDDDPSTLEKVTPDQYWGTLWSLRKHHHINTDITYGNLPTWLHYCIQKTMNPAKHYTDPVRYGTRKVNVADRIMHILMALPGIGPKKALPYRDMKLIPALQAIKPKVREDFREMIE